MKLSIPSLALALLANLVVADEAVMLSASAAYRTPQPAADAIVAYGDAARQFGELRLPDGDGPFGVAAVVHGGCWLSDYDHSYMAAFAEALTDLGIATWTIGYRRVGEAGGGWPNTFLDAGRALDHLRVLEQDYPIDARRVITVGHSAGGHLALWLAGRSRLAESSPLFTADPVPVRGVLALAAAADLELLSDRGDCGNAATRLIGGTFEEFPRRYADAAPQTSLPMGIEQILVNGDRDEQWSAPADRYFETARRAGDPIERRTAHRSGHFEPVVPGTTGWPTTETALRDLIERTGLR